MFAGKRKEKLQCKITESRIWKQTLDNVMFEEKKL